MKWLFIQLAMLLICFITYTPIQSQSIVVKLPDFAMSELELASCYGDKILSLKRNKTDEYGFTLFHNDTLASGVYYLYFNDSVKLEFLYDNPYPGKITISREKGASRFHIEGPQPVVCFHSFQNLIDSVKKADEKKSASSVALKNKKKQLVTSSKKSAVFNSDSLIDKTINDCPSDFLRAYLKAQQKPKIPDFKSYSDSVLADSTILKYQLEYYRKHFLDNVDLADSRLLRTPVYTQKISVYLEQMVSRQPDKLCKAVDFLIEKTNNDAICRPFMIQYLFEKYHNLKKQAIEEYVYLYIIEHYFLKSSNPAMSNDDLALINREYTRLKPVSLFEPAPAIEMTDIRGLPYNLQKSDGEKFILFFYNYDCSLCERITPELIKLKARYNYLNIKLIAICLGDEKQKWTEYVTSKNMSMAINLFEPEKAKSLAQNFNLSYTPTLFILNKNYEIEQKNITVAFLENYLFKLATEGK